MGEKKYKYINNNKIWLFYTIFQIVIKKKKTNIEGLNKNNKKKYDTFNMKL